MPERSPRQRSLKKSAAAVAATSLAVAGLALLAAPAPAAQAAADTPTKKGYAGAPVNPTPFTITQPDGTKVEAYRFGDKLSNGVATVKGHATIVKGSDGFWRYGAGLDANGDVKASGVVAGHGAAPAAAKGLQPAAKAVDTPSRAPKAGTGTDTELVILVSFTDSPSHTTEAEWANEYFGATGSVNAFYDESSNGQYGLAPAAETSGTANNGVVGWIPLGYAHPNTGVTNGKDTYVRDAITAASDYVDFASYDADDNGEITTDELHVTVIGAGFETSYGGPGNVCGGSSIWGHQWDFASGGLLAPTVDGVKVGDSGYTTFGEMHCEGPTSASAPGHKATMGIMAHEFGHDINWPDLYDVDYSSDGIGEWSLMAGGSWGASTGPGSLPGNSPAHPDAWALYYQDWVTPQAVTTATNDISVDTIASGGKPLLLNPNPGGVDWLFGDHSGVGEYFLVENRQQTGFDQSIPGCGLVVYRIDETVGSDNSANSDYNDPLVKVIQADGNDDLATEGDRGDAGDPYPGSSDNHALNDTTDPNTRFNDGTPSGLSVHVDSDDCDQTMQLDVLTPGAGSPAVVAPANDAFAAAQPLTGATGTVEQSTKKATEEAGEPEADGCGTASVWFTWKAPASGKLDVTTEGSGYDTVLGVYTGTAVNALTVVAENDDEDYEGGIHTSKVSPTVTAGTTYRIGAFGCAGSTGHLKMTWSAPFATATVAATAAPTTYGSAQTVNVTVAGPSGTPTGPVTLKEGAATMGTAALDGTGKATFALPANLAAGAHALTVSYAGDGSYAPANGTVTATVAKAASTTTATGPAKKVKFKKDFDITATVAAPAGSGTGTVEVYEGTKLLGSGTLANGTVTITVKQNLKKGKHTLTVKYLGSSNANGSQTDVKVKIKKKHKKKH